MGNEDAFFIFP